MAPKTKEISLDMRKHNTELHKERKSFRETGKILKLSFITVGYIVKKYLEASSDENKPRPGGPSKLTSRAKQMIVRSATNKPMTSAQNIANELLSSCNVSVSAQTIRNVLHSVGLKARELPERNLILVKRLETPPQSPDLNPIENLWMHLDTEVRGKNITSKENLKEKLQEVCSSIETQKSQRN
ncbi:paired domain-containing protein [Trichonephila clavipes]|nr:paired domain-containing protein [Trichonephila clavipes]